MEGKTILFVPDGSEAYYHACLIDAVDFPHSPGGAELALSDDDFGLAGVGGGNQVSLYGQAYASIYIGSNGYVTFGGGDTDWSESIEEHLGGLPRIAVFWDDLDPSAGGSITYRSLEDRMIVTWEDVTENASPYILSAQLLLYFDGTISITYLAIEPSDGLIGLSAGSTSPDFVPSDLSAYPACNLITCYYDADDDSYGADDDPGHLRAEPFCGAGYSENFLDCDDTDNAISPDGLEILDDGIDQNCDGTDASCCAGKVGDVNRLGGDEPTIGDISRLIDHLFITGAPLECYQEADINQSGGRYPIAEDITIGDISMLIDHLFISQILLNDCL
jgi:hypothetical protein